MTLREFRVFGPPGTGKTTFLVSEISRLAKRKGPDSIAICSFTRAGALEIATRVDLELAVYGLSIPRTQCKTVHGLAFATMGGGVEVAEAKPWVHEWNALHEPQGPEWMIEHEDAAEIAAHAKGAGGHLAHYSRARNLLLPSMDSYPEWLENRDLRDWGKKWEEFKSFRGLIDFTDMIEGAGDLPPNIRYLIVDEAQDLTPLEARLVRRWGAETDMLVLAGDDDQAIYDFRGGSPDVMLVPELPEEMTKILPKSYRMPSVIKDYTQNLIVGRVRNRKTKAFEPHEPGGYVEILKIKANETTLFADRIEAEHRTDPEGSIMVLASCRFFLKGVSSELKARGLGFHNPYQKGSGGFDSSNNEILKRLKCFLGGLEGYSEEPRWTLKDLAEWAGVLDWKSLEPTMTKKTIKESGTDPASRAAIISPAEVAEILGVEAQDLTPEWFLSHLMGSKAKLSGFAKSYLGRHGMNTLHEAARIIIGTIHSVKGAQADTVFLAPDISAGAVAAAKAEPAQDPQLSRLFYVGMTRAKKQLLLLRPTMPRRKYPFPKPKETGTPPTPPVVPF